MNYLIINVDKKVSINKLNNLWIIKGELGTKRFFTPKGLKIRVYGNFILIYGNLSREELSLYVVLLRNVLWGLNKGFKVSLELIGIGYKVEYVNNNMLSFKLGWSHWKNFLLPKGVVALLNDKGTAIYLFSNDKVLLGKTAKDIYNLRKPDSYKGKGVRFEGDVKNLKEGKKNQV